jgi:DNA-binding YbaB/EbfC family protein
MNPLNMFSQIAKIKEMVKVMGPKLEHTRLNGEAGGGIVKIILNGRMECISVIIDPIAVDPRDVAMLQTLIQSAYADAYNKGKTMLHKEMTENNLDSFAEMLK